MRNQKITLKEVRSIKKEYHIYIDGGSDTWIKLMFLMSVIYTLTYHKHEISELDSYWQYYGKDWDWNDLKQIQTILNDSFTQEEIKEIKSIL